MEQQANAFWLALQWVAITIGGILSLFGVKKLVELLLADWLTTRREKRAIHESSSAAKIAAETTLTQSLLTRIEKLESGQADLQAKLAEALAMVAGLKEKNKSLEEKNQKLEKENEERRNSMHQLRNELVSRDLKILNLQHEVENLKNEMHRVSDDIHKTDS